MKKSDTIKSEAKSEFSKQDSTVEKIDNLKMMFDRNIGFSEGPWRQIRKSFTKNGYKLIQKYTKRIEDELDFRFITTKKIEIVILVVLSISSLLLFLLESKESGFVFIFALVFFIYLLSIIKAKKQHELIKQFNSVVSDLDETYFGIKITNIFGKR
jgi:hypothetical protein